MKKKVTLLEITKKKKYIYIFFIVKILIVLDFYLLNYNVLNFRTYHCSIFNVSFNYV